MITTLVPVQEETEDGLRVRRCFFQAVLDDSLRALAEIDTELDRRNAPDAYVYVVQPGDTLAKIVDRYYGVSRTWDALAEYNGLAAPHSLEVGQSIKLPVAWPRRFRSPLDVVAATYYQFADIYAQSSPWAGKPHPGLDLHQDAGAPVYAIGEGVVIANHVDKNGYGHYLMIDHTTSTGLHVYSLYAHLQLDSGAFQTPAVGTVLRGLDIVIGYEGQTGAAGGLPHVHWEVKRTDEMGLYTHLSVYSIHRYYYNPIEFVARNTGHLCAPA